MIPIRYQPLVRLILQSNPVDCIKAALKSSTQAKIAVADTWEAQFELQHTEESAATRSALRHFCFLYSSPQYVNCNGRIGSFLVNLMLTSDELP